VIVMARALFTSFFCACIASRIVRQNINNGSNLDGMNQNDQPPCLLLPRGTFANLKTLAKLKKRLVKMGVAGINSGRSNLLKLLRDCRLFAVGT